MKLTQASLLTDENISPKVVAYLKPCYGILHLRLKNLKSVNVIRAWECLFQQDIEIDPYTIWVIEDARIRIRYLVEEE
jgi:hypothetical protein